MADNDSITAISRDDRENAAGVPIFVQLTDGTTVLSSTAGALHVDIQDATIAVTQSGTWILGANDGVDIGDVTINNAAGASAVNIQDGGNSITVDAVNLDIRDLSETTDHVLIFANTAANGTGTDTVPLVDAAGHLQVDVLTLPALSIGDASGTRIHDFATSAAVAIATAVNHDYTSTTAAGFKLQKISAASSGASKIEVEIGQAGSGVDKYTAFIPSEGGVVELNFAPGLIVANTEEVRVVHTNRNKTKAQDLYSTIMGDQLP